MAKHIPVLLKEAVAAWRGSSPVIARGSAAAAAAAAAATAATVATGATGGGGKTTRFYVDLTCGAGGHTLELLRRDPCARVLCIDRDISSLDLTSERLSAAVAGGACGVGREGNPRDSQSHESDHLRKRAFLRCGNFADLPVHLQAWRSLDRSFEGSVTGGILADLGVSSMQIDDGTRGFSFQKEGPLDMRMNVDSRDLRGGRGETESLGHGLGITAAELLQILSEEELASLFVAYGGESSSRAAAAARAIISDRRRWESLKTATALGYTTDKGYGAAKGRETSGAAAGPHDGEMSPFAFSTTESLVACLRPVLGRIPRNRGSHSIHPATRIFQAIRVAVNDEMGSLAEVLGNRSRSACGEDTGRGNYGYWQSLDLAHVRVANEAHNDSTHTGGGGDSSHSSMEKGWGLMRFLAPGATFVAIAFQPMELSQLQRAARRWKSMGLVSPMSLPIQDPCPIADDAPHAALETHQKRKQGKRGRGRRKRQERKKSRFRSLRPSTAEIRENPRSRSAQMIGMWRV